MENWFHRAFGCSADLHICPILRFICTDSKEQGKQYFEFQKDFEKYVIVSVSLIGINIHYLIASLFF